jgi:hypothetical protein
MGRSPQNGGNYFRGRLDGVRLVYLVVGQDRSGEVSFVFHKYV